ncbi:MAG: prepilin-type N-terminal cleavage/methylation domain-containing protein [Planctomycetota bacterium]
MKRQLIEGQLMTKTRAALRRGGFTLVELMVSIGLTLFIMVIIVEAFTLSLDSFQGFRAVGELTTQVRSALYLVRTDLAQSHLEASRRPSDPGFWESPRREGFFVVRQGTAPNAGPNYRDEGVDFDGVRSSIATDHVLHFSNRLRGNRRDQFVIETAPSQTATLASSQTMVPKLLTETNYMASTDAGLTSSQWSEVSYFLRPMLNPSTGAPLTIAEPYSPGQFIPLYNLYRTQLLVFPYTDTINTLYNYDAAVPTGAFNSVKMYSRAAAAGPNNKIQFYSPNDLAKGAATRSLNPAAPDTSRASLVATNVVSFQVRIIKIGDAGFEDLPGPFPATFDTAVPQNFRLGGVQVILRLFDPSTGLTRQGTLIQDL